MYGKVEDVKSTQEPRYCVLRGTKEDLTSRLFPGLGKAECQYTANGQLSSKGNFKPFDGGRERYNLNSRSKPVPSLSYSGCWQGDFHTYLSWESCSLGPVKGKNSRRRSSPGSLLLSCLQGAGSLTWPHLLWERPLMCFCSPWIIGAACSLCSFRPWGGQGFHWQVLAPAQSTSARFAHSSVTLIKFSPVLLLGPLGILRCKSIQHCPGNESMAAALL